MTCEHLETVIDLLTEYGIEEMRDDPHESAGLVCPKCKDSVWLADIIPRGKGYDS